MTKNIVTFTVDRNVMFDMIAGVGDGGRAIGQRLAEAMLIPNDISLNTKLNLAAYGITLDAVEPSPPQPTATATREDGHA